MNNLEIKFKRNYQYYKAILCAAELAFQEQRIEEAIKIAQSACEFSSSNYCGFYYESSVENLLNGIGKKLLVKHYDIKKIADKKQLRVLHYASIVTNIGGHTRLLNNWIRNDVHNQHSLFLGQQNGEIPTFVIDTIENNNGVLYCHNDKESFIDRIKALYKIIINFDVVILHHHPHDVIPVIAAAHTNIPPVAVLNHGDHKYWVGNAICDILIEIRDNLIPYDEERRLIKEFSVLPIPVSLPVQGGHEEARRILKVDVDEIILLTIGAEYKYVPFDNKNFFEDIIEVLNLFTSVKLFVVGISADSAIATKYFHPRILFVKATPELDIYRRACDIYIEGYPFSSFTAYLEVGLLKKPIQYMYDAPLLNKYNLSNYRYPPAYYINKLDWKKGLLELIQSSLVRSRQSNNTYNDILDNHVSPRWNSYLNSFYEKIINKKHSIRVIENNQFIFTNNEIYLDKIISHSIVTIFFMVKDLTIRSKMILINKFFIANDYLDLMFHSCGVHTLYEVISWPFLYKLGFIYRALISKKISLASFIKYILSRMKKKIYQRMLLLI